MQAKKLLLRKALGDRSGSTAVEFALVAPTFLALMFSIFEVGWFYFVNAQVDAATLNAARMIRTGQVQQAGLTKQQFFDAVCPPLKIFGDCQSTITVEVKKYANFAALAADTSQVVCVNDQPSQINAIPYEPGVDGEIVRLKICILYKTINPLIGVNVSNVSGGKRKVAGVYLFRNEPYTKKSGNS